ncbi:MAG: hypothetical protein OXC62_01120 [Aestuariivita sp.]|nr:hypothetical protein [Aestuariivita sp.]
MFIVRTRTNTARDGSPHVTHRLVENRREGTRQGPPEDIAEPWPHVLHCKRGLAAGVPVGG